VRTRWKQLNWTLAGILALALLAGVTPAQSGNLEHGGGKDPDQLCQSLKLLAVIDYCGCLVRAADDHGKQSRCDDRFPAAFGKADALSPGREPLANITDTTVMWMQAWGASGWKSHDYSHEGVGGFAQTVTSISDLQNRQGALILYYYLGNDDQPSGNPGRVNTGRISLTFTSGQRGPGANDNDICASGGGGGGGGWGGGGGSDSIASTQSDGDAPTSLPSNPNGGTGFFQLAFNLDPK
jgi:hypothetical protein